MNRYINIIRLAAQYWVPGLGTLFFTLGSIWGWSFTENVVGTIMAVDTFLGVLVGINMRGSKGVPGAYDGHFEVNMDDPSKDTYTINLGTALADIENRDSVRLKVVNTGKAPQE